MTITTQGISQANNSAFRNPWVIGWIALVLIVLGVNATFIVLAVKTNPGLVDKDYYEKGRQFERNVQQQIAARNALGWSGQLDVPADLSRGQPTTIRFSVVDDKGMPMTPVKVVLGSYRPSDASADFSVEMKPFAPGQYEAQLAYGLKGLWELTARVSHGDQQFDLLKRRINVAE